MLRSAKTANQTHVLPEGCYKYSVSNFGTPTPCTDRCLQKGGMGSAFHGISIPRQELGVAWNVKSEHVSSQTNHADLQYSLIHVHDVLLGSISYMYDDGDHDEPVISCPIHLFVM
jgi:hypothetical protein